MIASRREFLQRVAGGSAALLVASNAVAQQAGRGGQSGAIHEAPPVVRDTSNLFAMDQEAAQPVRKPPKPGATPQLTADQRDDLEHRIHCQCGCTLDMYTCRTTDFSCKVSPAMHRDVVSLVEGGYSAQEIIDAFVGVYGERALMAPKKSGFNLVAWFGPGAAVVLGGAALAVLLRRWGRTSRRSTGGAPSVNIDATPDELAQVEAAVRGDDA
jgi:cytochrome c-type biogenesis protein CcmH